MKDDCDFAVFKYRTIKNVLLDNNRKLKHEMPFIKQSAMSERVNMNSRVAYEAPRITSHKRRYFLMCKKSFLTFAICRRLDAWCVTKSRGKRPSNWAVPWSLSLSLCVCVNLEFISLNEHHQLHWFLPVHYTKKMCRFSKLFFATSKNITFFGFAFPVRYIPMAYDSLLMHISPQHTVFLLSHMLCHHGKMNGWALLEIATYTH